MGGVRDTHDRSVVLILAQSTATEKECTGFLVSPHVVVTAAHCLSPAVLGSDKFSFYVYLGDDIDDPAQNRVGQNFVRVAETHFDPAFLPDQLGAGHDVGVIVTKTPISAAAIPMRASPLGDDLVGTATRSVGFGKISAATDAAYGARYETPSSIAAIYQAEAAVADGPPGGCEGDSGGPLLLKIGDTEVAIGIFSWMEHAASCTGKGHYSRMDVMRAFVEPYVKAADPDFALPLEPTPTAAADGGTTDSGVGDSSGRGCAIASHPVGSTSMVWLTLLLIACRARRRADG